MVFYAQGGSREVRARKNAVQGSQMDLLDGPIAGLVEGDTFIQAPFSGPIKTNTPELFPTSKGSLNGPKKYRG